MESTNATVPPEGASAAPEGSVFRRVVRKVALAALCLGLVGGGGYSAWSYWTKWRFEISTDDAYVQADVVPVAPEVSGTISKVLVGDNETVKAGQVLAVVDQQNYQASVRLAEARVAQAEAAVATNEALLSQQHSVIAQAEAALAADKAQAEFAEQNNRRYSALAKDGSGSIQNAQQAASATATANATIQKDQAALEAAHKQVATLKAELDQAKAGLTASQAALQQAQISLGFTTITSPVDGVVGARSLRLGEFVQPGTQILQVVPLEKTYIVANFEETQLQHVRPGQPVAISVDAFPERVVAGIVESLSPASGQEFALLPPDNATGNFTKVVQRIPIKIKIAPSDPLAGKLRPGMSTTATIDVRNVLAPETAKP